MALDAILWALRDADCSASEKLVLAVLCNWIDEHTDCSWPSVATIKDWTGQGERTIGRAINGLEARGLVARPDAQHRRKGRFAQNVLHIGLRGPAVPPTPEVIDACLEIMRHRRSAPSAKLTPGDGSPSANMTPGDGQIDAHRRPNWPTVSIEDPVRLSSYEKPVRAGRPAGRRQGRRRDDRTKQTPPGLPTQLADLQAMARQRGLRGADACARLVVIDDRITAPSQAVLDQVLFHLSSECRVFGIEIDQAVVSA